MAATQHRYNDIVFLEWSKGMPGYRFVSIPENGSIVGCNKTVYKHTAALDCPVYKSYTKDNKTQGITLRGKVERRRDLLSVFNADEYINAIKISDFNVGENLDIFPHQHEKVIMADYLKAKFNENLGANLTTDWSQKLAGAIQSEMERIKDQYGSSGVQSVFGQAAKAAVLRTKKPKENMSSIFRLKPFTIEAVKAFLGLGSNVNDVTFQYKFGASILFNPVFMITTEDGSANINLEIKYFSGNAEDEFEPETVCGKAIVFYNASDLSTADYPTSFAFRPDDTYTPASVNSVRDEIMSFFHNFPNTQFDNSEIQTLVEGAKRRLEGDTNGPWGNGWSSPAIIADPKLRVKAKLNNPRDGRALGVYEIRFSFNFGEQDGALWLGNFLLSFIFDVQNYLAAVNATQQAKARYREAVENAKRKAEKRAQQIASANATEAAAPTTPVKLDETPDADPNTNYATRDQNATDTIRNDSDGDIIDGGDDLPHTPVEEVNADVDKVDETNDGNDTNINTESDIVLPLL